MSGRSVETGTAARRDRGFVTVPVELLERPRREDTRRIDRFAGSLEIDRQLRRLGRQGALCRRVLGTIAAAFLDREAHHLLGFARVGDYSRERLGLSPRELQDAARVSRALNDLPATTAAFEHGELSWTQARLLATVATRDDERVWLARASGRTTRALQSLIRADGTGSVGTGADAGSVGVGSPHTEPNGTTIQEATRREAALRDEALVDGEPAVRFRIRCPRRVRARWRHVVELARRMAGEQLAPWQAVEAVAAEGLSASGMTGHGGDSELDEPCSRVIDPAFQPRIETGALGPNGASTASETLTERQNETLAEATTATPAARGDALRDTPGDTPGDVLGNALDETAPTDVTALAHQLSTTDVHTLDARLRAVVRVHQQIDWQTGRLLRAFADLRLHRALGFTSMCGYVRERLGISPRKAQALIAVERRVWQAPAFGEAYRRGELSLIRALTLLPVLSEEYAEAWVERANAVTVRRLAADVDWALDAQDTTRPYRLATPPPLAPGAPITDVVPVALAALSRPGRVETAEVQMRAHTGWETIDAEITIIGPASVMGLFRAAIAARAVSPEPGWRALERLLMHVEHEWTAQPRHRNPVFARDGWRCTVPACSGRRNLHDHHVLFRSHGGSNLRDNRVTVCAWHHLRAIHARTVRARGKAPDAIRWDLGIRASGPPLASFVGDC